MTYTPPAIGEALPVGSVAVLVATVASTGGSGTLQNAGQFPCWYGTSNTVTTSNGTLLAPGSPPVPLVAGTSYYCIAVAGQATSVVATTWVSNIPGSNSSSGSSLAPLMALNGTPASGSWSTGVSSTTVGLGGANEPPMTVGDMVLVGANEYQFNGAPPSITTMTDTNGNTWNKIKRSATSASGSLVDAATEIWYTIVTVGGATTLTLNLSATTGTGQVAVLELEKTIGSAWVIDVSNTANTGSSTTGTSSIAFPALTPTGPFELYLGTFANTGSPGSVTYPLNYSVSYPFVYSSGPVSSPQSPAIACANSIIWATVGVCIGVFSPTGNATSLQGNAVSATAPTTNYVMAWNGSAWTPTAPGSANATSIQGSAVSTTAPTNGQVLVWNGTSYTPATPSNANATQIQGVAVSATAPSNGQALIYNGSQYVPATPSGASNNNVDNIYTNAAFTGTVNMQDPTVSPYYEIDHLTLTGNGTVNMIAPSLGAGAEKQFWIDQTGSNNYSLSWTGTAIRWSQGVAASAPTGGQRLWVAGVYDGSQWNMSIVSIGY